MRDERLLRGTQVLLLHADAQDAAVLRLLLETQGCCLHWYADPLLAATFARERRPDIVLLDEAAAASTTADVLARCHREGWVGGCLMLAERGTGGIAGLHAGADDFLLKPVDPDELVARMLAVLRRAGRTPGSRRIVHFDPGARCARIDGRPVMLTAMESAVFGILAARPGRIYRRSDLESEVSFAGHGGPQSNSLEVIVSRLRKKLGEHVIRTHRSLGYSFNPAAVAERQSGTVRETRPTGPAASCA